ncbi:MAG: fumarylacetoacetate hydrolase family protein [Acidobacteriota bacterium]
MRLLTFKYKNIISYGVITGDGVIDLGKHFGARFASLRSALTTDAREELKRFIEGRDIDLKLNEVEFLPVIPDPEKILCIGINYEKHRLETGRDKTEYPVIFTRFINTQVGQGQPLLRPKVSEKFDYEGELAVIIGDRGRYIQAQDALKHVAGYACYNDATVRDWQRHSSQFTPGKNFPCSGGFGPWLVTTDEIADPNSLTLVTRLNGAEMQRTSTADMIYPVTQLIAYISTFTELKSGDVIATGTPDGVGYRRTPPVYLRAGDRIEVEISQIGTLANPIVDETSQDTE